MGTFSRGITFASNEQVTNTKLATLLDSASLSNTLQSDITSSEGLIHIGVSAPSDTDQLWLDSLSTPYTLKTYNGSAWVPVIQWKNLTNKAGQTLSQGHVVTVDTSNDESFKVSSSGKDLAFAGVVLNSVAANAIGNTAMRGFGIIVNTEVSATAGSFLRSSTSTGKADITSNFSRAVFGILTSSASVSGNAKLFGSLGDGTSVGDNNTWTGNQTYSGNVSFTSGMTLTTASASSTNWTPVVQIVRTLDGASAQGSTAIPYDDTIPQVTEGTQFMSRSITPKHANNNLLIDVEFVGSVQGAGGRAICVALFQDSTGDAKAAVIDHFNIDDGMRTIRLIHYMTAGTTASTTFSVRAGQNGGQNVDFNGTTNGHARRMGGVMASSISIMELKG